MTKHHVIDYETFLPRLVEGLRKTWEEARRERPDETFYMFGISTDSDATALVPFCYTEEQYAEQGESKISHRKMDFSRRGLRHTSPARKAPCR